MRTSVRKHGALEILMVFVLVVLGCTITFAENGGEDSGEKEVLTTLEQRMQQRIDVIFREAEITDVIRSIADMADVDIVISPRVEGLMTCTLTQVPLEEALSNILAAHGYDYVVDKNVIRVAPTSEITQVAEKLVSRIYRITYANIEEVEKALNKFKSQRGTVSSNPGTSNIIVTDTESKIKAIDTFIEEIDRETPQILVEARIYDITSKDRLDLGIEWQAGRNTVYPIDVTTHPPGTWPGTDPADHATTAKEIGDQHAMNPLVDRNPFITGAFGAAVREAESTTGVLRFGFLAPGIDIDVALRAEQEKICATLLANPRIMVLDNQTAAIKIVEELAFQELTQTSAGGNMATTKFREVGVELQVTPHLTRGDMVRLNLKPKFSIDTGRVQQAAAQFPQPIVDRREADTMLLIKSGQTVVLGGLRKKSTAQQLNKVPLLGDLPLLGPLFKFEAEETILSELVVFVTPRIIENPVMTEAEAAAYDVTEICGPKCGKTRLTPCEE